MFMTAPSTLPCFAPGFALAGLGCLLVSTVGHAETRLISDPNGVLVSAAPPQTERSGCCSTGNSATVNADADSLAPPTGEATLQPPAETSVTPKAPDLVPVGPAETQAGWRNLLSDLIQLGGASR
jgi:hypothetical protein